MPPLPRSLLGKYSQQNGKIEKGFWETSTLERDDHDKPDFLMIVFRF